MGTCMGILSRGGRRGSTFSSVPTMRHKSLLTTASLKGASTVFATFILLHLTTTPTTSEPIEVDPLELLALLSRHDFIRGWEKGGIISQKRGPGSEFLGKRVPGSEFLGKRGSSTFNSPQFLYHKRAPGSEFLGKRALGSEFLGKRAPGSEFLGKRAPGSEFLGKRAPGSEFLGKRAPGSEFLGKRYDGEIKRWQGDSVLHPSYSYNIAKRSPELAVPLKQSDRENHLSKSAIAAILAQEALDKMTEEENDRGRESSQ